LNILLVYPEYPDTFWGFKHALRFVSKKAAFPPLGLLTVAAMLPKDWKKKLVDMNTRTLTDRELAQADYVFISAMSVQRESARQIIKRCKKLCVKTVAGGPLFTSAAEEFDDIDHLVLNEAEITLPLFLKDLEIHKAKHLYTSMERPELNDTPIPAWELLDIRKYSSMNVQYSRGCPFDCEFCDIVVLNGHRPRTKSKEQLLTELDAIYHRGWRRGSVFIVDDNFIGNKKKLKAETLPAIAEWMKGKGYPFTLLTESSINLADDEELMTLMVKSNFNMVFVGIETPNESSLAECGKHNNENRDMIADVKKLQNHGLQVQGGFILGFDNDDPTSIFESLISFIQKSGIVTAMVGLLNAPRDTKLHKRLGKENRLRSVFSGNNTDFSTNFIPKMNMNTLIDGYSKVVRTIYSPKQYYERIILFLKEYRPARRKISRVHNEDVAALIKSLFILGMKEHGRQYFWKLIVWTLAKRPRSFPLSITLAIYGFHFRKIAEGYTLSPSSNC